MSYLIEFALFELFDRLGIIAHVLALLLFRTAVCQPVHSQTFTPGVIPSLQQNIFPIITAGVFLRVFRLSFRICNIQQHQPRLKLGRIISTSVTTHSLSTGNTPLPLRKATPAHQACRGHNKISSSTTMRKRRVPCVLKSLISRTEASVPVPVVIR